jgi:hypothetical protein
LGQGIENSLARIADERHGWLANNLNVEVIG